MYIDTRPITILAAPHNFITHIRNLQLVKIVKNTK